MFIVIDNNLLKDKNILTRFQDTVNQSSEGRLDDSGLPEPL